MSPGPGFAFFLLLTLALLGLAVAAGLRARRRRHVTLVACALVSLAIAIVFARKVGEHYDLASAGAVTPIHHALARLTTVAYLLPIATGVLTIYRPSTRRLHRALAFLVLGMTVLTAITGTLMLMLARPLG